MVKQSALTLITWALRFWMGPRAGTCAELAVEKSSGELVKNRDWAYCLRVWISTSENLLKNENIASQVVWTWKPDLGSLVSHHPLTPAWSDPWLLWKPLSDPSARLDFTSTSFFKYTAVSKIEGIIFGREDVFSLSRYLYLERKSEVPKRQKAFPSETKFNRKRASLTTAARLETTNEQLFPEASFRLSGASFASRCCKGPGWGPGFTGFPGWSEGLVVAGQDGIKILETPAWGRPGKGCPYRITFRIKLTHMLLYGQETHTEPPWLIHHIYALWLSGAKGRNPCSFRLQKQRRWGGERGQRSFL